MPFVTAGDPDLEFTGELLTALDAAGCDLVEIGFPYSDPIADGPVIQSSYGRALENGIDVEQVFRCVADLSASLSTPLVAMVSYAIVFRIGPHRFAETAASAGFAGLIVPDLPLEESEALRTECADFGLQLIELITPTTRDDRAIEIANRASGFIYYVSVAGTTGQRSELPEQLVSRLSWLRSKTKVPVCVGFGISLPEHATRLAPHADGLIVGSAIVQRIADWIDQSNSVGQDDRQELITGIVTYVRSMISATNEDGERQGAS